MNFLRASPVRPWEEAKPLQLFIFSCCGVSFFVSVLAAGAGAASAGLAFRHSLRNFLYASPLRPLAFASALQVFIFSCCAVSASAGTDRAARATSRTSFLIVFPLFTVAERHVHPGLRVRRLAERCLGRRHAAALL